MTAKIKLNAASGGGSISIQAPSSSSNNRVISLPDIADGTLVTSQSTLDATKLSGALPAISGANLTGLSAGITMTDQWRVTSNFNHGPGAGTITSNWEQNDTLNGDVTVGASMTESSGVFTFPSTGLYLIRFYMNAKATNMQYAGVIIKGTTDNFSSVDSNLANNYDSMGQGIDYFACVMCEAFFDVANTSVNKVKFNLNSQNTIAVEGSTDYQRTGVTFIRFGDT